MRGSVSKMLPSFVTILARPTCRHLPLGSRKTQKSDHNIAGVDIEADFDLWIDRFCLDADLFVWVVNGESTLMRREKAFFEQVAAKLAKPNILVVVNR